MNKIIEKLKVPGYETRTIITPRQNYQLKEIKDVQLSLDFKEMKSTNTEKKK